VDAKTVATLVGCLVTVVGALAYLSRSMADTARKASGAAEKASSESLGLIRELAVSHIKSVEQKLDTLAEVSKEISSAVRENTATVALLVERFDAPPPTGGVVTPTSEDETPPLGFIRKDGTRAPAGRYQFRKTREK